MNCIMSGQLDDPSSSFKSNLSDDNDKPDLQKNLIEESRQRHLYHKKSMQLKQAHQRYEHKTEKKSVTALLKEFNIDW